MSISNLSSLQVKNYRILVDISLNTGQLTVLFGPNGVGKSTLLDTVWFIRDCAIRGTDEAAAEHSHGIGMLWEGATTDVPIEIRLETDEAWYKVAFGFSSGRIEIFAGEQFFSKKQNLLLIDRKIGSDKAVLRTAVGNEKTVSWHEANKLFISRYLLENDVEEVAILDGLLRNVRHYHARSANFYRIRQLGSTSSNETRLQGRADNLWSVLRNLQGKQAIDNRYQTIIDFMRRAFPYFKDLVLEATGPNGIYGHFVEQGKNKPIHASGVSDGHLQMLINLTALFSETNEVRSLISLDEPDLSLHPWALSILAEAMKEAVKRHNKQVIVATHSPVLMSQFELTDVIAVEFDRQRAAMFTPIHTMSAVADLLEDYATGSLYMSESIAPQNPALTTDRG